MNSIAHTTTLATEDNRSTVKNYISLMKPRVMSLVIFTGFSGAWLAPSSIHSFIAFIAVLCIALGAGSAGTINMWYDRDIDRLMKRTQKRPLITGVIEADEALSFGIITGFFSVFFMALCVNFLAAALLLFTICYYIFIYTMWLKRSTVQNIVIGGVAGALPPMIGWAAVSNEISTASFILFLIIFIWTPPHSWSLALFCNEDYKNCKVPMMPAVKGAYYTKKQVLIYSIALFITSLMPFFIKISNFTYLVIAVILGIIFLYYSISLFRDTSDTVKSARATPIIIGETMSNDVGKRESFDCNKQAKRLFAYSIFYLFAVFLALDFCKTAI